MTDVYHDRNRMLQELLESKPMADRLAETIIQPAISPEDKTFIEEQNMFFLATVDNKGNPNCSYKGGARGFVRVLYEGTLVFPSYDGNSMFLSMGNILVASRVGLLFVDFNRQTRLRVNGDAFIDLADPLLQEYHEVDMIVRVKVRQVFPNCPRYVHKMQLVEESVFVPNAMCQTPAPPWKSLEMVSDVLPEKNKHLAGLDQDRFKAINRDVKRRL
jgi:uncharacterized protein